MHKIRNSLFIAMIEFIIDYLQQKDSTRGNLLYLDSNSVTNDKGASWYIRNI